VLMSSIRWVILTLQYQVVSDTNLNQMTNLGSAPVANPLSFLRSILELSHPS
jgi:hypothetical protein